jgi:hypothetical protein
MMGYGFSNDWSGEVGTGITKQEFENMVKALKPIDPLDSKFQSFDTVYLKNHITEITLERKVNNDEPLSVLGIKVVEKEYIPDGMVMFVNQGSVVGFYNIDKGEIFSIKPFNRLTLGPSEL